MPSVSLLGINSDLSNGTTATSGTFSPAANSLLVVFADMCNHASAITLSSITDTFTGTGSWTIGYIQVSQGGKNSTLGYGYAVAGGSPGSGAVTATFDQSNRSKHIAVYQVTDYNTSTPIDFTFFTGKTGGSSSTLTLTHATPASDSSVLAAVLDGDANTGVTPDSNFTEDGEVQISPGGNKYGLQVQHDLAGADNTTSWSTLSSASDDDVPGVAIGINAAASGPQTITLTAGIASAEAFGTPTLTLFLLPTGIATAESFGTPQLNLKLEITAIATAEAFGTAVITTGPVDIAPSGIASGETFGTATLTLYLLPTGIATGEAFGTAQVNLGIAPTGIASAEAFGTTNVIGTQDLAPTGIASGESFGTATLTLFLLPTGIATAESFGTAQLNLFISVTGIASGEAFGTALFTLFITPTGIASTEAFGTANVTTGAQFLEPTGIASGEVFGTAAIIIAQDLSPTGLASGESFGTTTVSLVSVPSVGAPGKKDKKREPFLPEPISFAQRKREWKEHVEAVGARMRALHSETAQKRRQAVESTRPTTSVEAERAKTRQHKKPGLKVQRPKFARPVPQKPSVPQPPRKTEKPVEAPLDRTIRIQQEAEKRKELEHRIEQQMIADEKQMRENAAREKAQAWKRKKTALVNLELAKERKAQIDAEEAAKNEIRLKNLKKARAAKRRKAKKAKRKKK